MANDCEEFNIVAPHLIRVKAYLLTVHSAEVDFLGVCLYFIYVL